MDYTRWPRLREALSESLVWLEHDVYVGRASDGVVVDLGMDEHWVEIYLEHNPTPSAW